MLVYIYILTTNGVFTGETQASKKDTIFRAIGYKTIIVTNKEHLANTWPTGLNISEYLKTNYVN